MFSLVSGFAVLFPFFSNIVLTFLITHSIFYDFYDGENFEIFLIFFNFFLKSFMPLHLVVCSFIPNVLESPLFIRPVSFVEGFNFCQISLYVVFVYNNITKLFRGSPIKVLGLNHVFQLEIFTFIITETYNKTLSYKIFIVFSSVMALDYKLVYGSQLGV